MQRLTALLAVVALAGTAWWIASTVASGPSGDTPTADEGLVVHVHVLDRAGKPVSPAQIVRVYDESRETVDGNGYARLTNVTLRADEEPSADAFTYAFKVLTRGHALRRGFTPEVTERDDGSWDVRYALHAHGTLRVHVEPVNLGTCKAFLERDEPLRRWEPVGGHAVVRPGSVVDFRIYEGWDAPGHDGKIAVRLQGEAGADGVIAIATQRVLVDAPSPGHTAQLKLVPEPVDPIAGVVRVKEGPLPPTLRGAVLVHRVQDDGSRVYMGSVPIDDEGSFVIRDAGTETYELIAGLDFAPGVIEAKAKGGDYLELETVGRARWAVLEHPGFDATASRLHVGIEPQGGSKTYLPSVLSHDMQRWQIEAIRQFGPRQRDGAESAEETAAISPRVMTGKERTIISLADGGAWKVSLGSEATFTRPAYEGVIELTLPPASSETTTTVEMKAVDHESVTVRVEPEGWQGARSATVTIDHLHRTVVKGGKPEVTFPFVRSPHRTSMPSGEARVIKTSVVVTWDDPAIAPQTVELEPLDAGEARPVVVARARPGSHVHLRATGPRAPYATARLLLVLQSPDKTDERPPPSIELRRRGIEPIWESVSAVPPGSYQASVSALANVVEAEREGGFWGSFGGIVRVVPLELRAGETTTVDLEFPAK